MPAFTNSLYADIKFNELSLPMTDVDFESIVLSYGFLSVIPTLRFTGFDRFGVTTGIKGWYPITLKFGNGPDPNQHVETEFLISSKLSQSGIRLEENQERVLDFAGHNLQSASLINDRLPKAFKVNSLQEVYDHYNFSYEREEPLVEEDDFFFVYKGYETALQFLSNLTYFATSEDDVPGMVAYINLSGEGKVVSFIDKINSAEGKDVKPSNLKDVVRTRSHVYKYTHAILNNNLKWQFYKDALYHTYHSRDEENETDSTGTTLKPEEWQDFVPYLTEELFDPEKEGAEAVEGGIEPIRTFDIGRKNDLQRLYLDTYANNHEFWRFVRNYLYTTTIQGYISGDPEVGHLYKITSNTGASGLYVVLQKLFFVKRNSGIYTKLYGVVLKRDPR